MTLPIGPRRVRRATLSLVAWGLLAGASAGCAHRACVRVGPDFVPSAERVDCPDDIDLPAGTRCGRVVTALQPGEVGSCRLELPYVRLRATLPQAVIGPRGDGTPAVLLPGGPGQVVLWDVERLAALTRPWRLERDLILIDPRGGGASSPRLACDDDVQLQRRWRSRPPASMAEWVGDCAESARAQGLAPEGFGTADLADDIAVLADFEGEGRLHVVGGSYGTRWALALSRRHPERVASLVLGAVAPWDQELFEQGPRRFLEVLDEVFVACADDPACPVDLGDPWERLWERVEGLDETPLVIDISLDEVRIVTGQVLLWLLHTAARSSALLPALPALVESVVEGEDLYLPALLELLGGSQHELLLHHVIQCTDAFPFADPAAAAASFDPRFPAWDPYSEQAPICAALGLSGSRPASSSRGLPSARTAPDLDVPVLLLAGALDPMAPPSWAADVATLFPRHRLWIDGRAGHDVMRSTCAAAQIGEFLAHPTGGRVPACAEEIRALEWVVDPFDAFDAVGVIGAAKP